MSATNTGYYPGDRQTMFGESGSHLHMWKKSNLDIKRKSVGKSELNSNPYEDQLEILAQKRQSLSKVSSYKDNLTTANDEFR